MLAFMIDDSPTPPTLTPNVAMTVTFVSDQKKFAFCARHDTGESVYVSPLLAEQAGLDRKSAGRELLATISANTDEFAGSASSTTPWRVMSWAQSPTSIPVMVDGEICDLRAELEGTLALFEQGCDRLRQALKRLP